MVFAINRQQHLKAEKFMLAVTPPPPPRVLFSFPLRWYLCFSAEETVLITHDSKIFSHRAITEHHLKRMSFGVSIPTTHEYIWTWCDASLSQNAIISLPKKLNLQAGKKINNTFGSFFSLPVNICIKFVIGFPRTKSCKNSNFLYLVVYCIRGDRQ